MSRMLCASSIGYIMYTMTYIRPELAYAPNLTSIYQANPGRKIRTNHIFVIYGAFIEDLVLRCYTYANFKVD